jgi:hypothetical protein
MYNRQAEQLVNILFMCRIWNSHDGDYEEYQVFWDMTPCTASIFRVEYGGITFFWDIGQFLVYVLHSVTTQMPTPFLLWFI